MAVGTTAVVGTQKPILGLDHAAIPARDPYLAACFYNAVLGSELVHETKHRSLFLGVKVCDGFMFDLFERGEDEPPVELGIIHYAFTIPAEDVPWWVEHLKYWQVPFFANTRDVSVSLYFQDLDENHLELTAHELPDSIRQLVPAGLYHADGSYTTDMPYGDRHPKIERWPTSGREEEARRAFEQKLENVRARSPS